MSNIFNKKGALIDAINQIRESVSKEYADEHKQKAMAARNSGKMSDYHKHMATHHDHLATHHTDKGDTRAADLHMNKATEHEAKAKEVSEAKCMTKEAKLDKVQPAELKKDHSERKDKDIDNDGDVDSSDEYLHKRRQAISKAMKSEGFSEAEIANLLDTLDEAAPPKYNPFSPHDFSQQPKINSKETRGAIHSDHKKAKALGVSYKEFSLRKSKYNKQHDDLVKQGKIKEDLEEATPSSQQVKQGIGIARDKRYAGGNMTGAVKAMDKLNKGLARHPAVEKELQKQNEEVEDIKEYEMSRRADGKYVDDEGNVMSSPTSRWAAKKVTSDRYRPNPSSSSYKSKYRKEEVDIEEEQIDELTAAEKKLVNTMYDKKGNLTDSGKKVRAHSQNKFPHNVSASQGERMSAKGTMYREEVELDEAVLDESELAKQWRSGKSSIKSGNVELIRSKSGVHTIKKGGKTIGDFSLDYDGWVVGVKGKKGQTKLVSVDDIVKMASSMKESVVLDEAYTHEEEQIDELSKKTLGSYLRKASADAVTNARSAGVELGAGASKRKDKYERDENKVVKRLVGISKATQRLAKEEFDIEIQEAEQFAGWIAHHNGKKLEIRKHEAKDLHGAKQKAIAHFKPKKSQQHMVSVQPAYEEVQVEDESLDESKKELLKKGADLLKKRAEANKKAMDTGFMSMPDYARKKFDEEVDSDSISEQSDKEEKHEMAQTQAHFIKYAAEEIIEYIEMGGEIEEWYQNKLSKVHSDVESLHSYMEGEKRRTGMSEEADLEEAKELSPKQNLLLRAMATDPQDINKMRRAIKLGDKALMNPVMRQEILKMLDQMMDVSLSDPTIFAKTRQIFKKRKATDTTNTE